MLNMKRHSPKASETTEGTNAQSPSVPNPLKQRDPELFKSFAALQAHIGDVLLDSLAPLLADPHIRARHAPGYFADLHAVAQVLRVLVKPRLTEHDLDLFDAHWRDAIRSGLGAEFEADKHRIQAAVDTARTRLTPPEPEVDEQEPAKPAHITQRTLW